MKNSKTADEKVKIIFKCTSCDHEEIKEIKCSSCGASMIPEEEIAEREDHKELAKEYEEYQDYQGKDDPIIEDEEDLDYDGLSDFGESVEDEDIEEKDFYQL